MNEKAVELLREWIAELDTEAGTVGVGVVRRRLLKIIHELR